MVIYDNKGNIILDIEVADTSVRYKAIKGENSLTLKYSLAVHVEVPIGSYAIFKNEKYILMSPEDVTLKHRRYFDYSLVMHSEDARAKRYMFINPIDKRLKFSVTAKPVEHLQMFVDNMNMRDGKDYWSIGSCPDDVEIVLSYNHTYCHDALVQIADKLKLDYWYEGNVVNIGKLEINKDNPLPLSYGGDGQGLKAEIKRNNYNAALPVEVLYIQGSEKNIDLSKYGSAELHLPISQTIGYDGEHFEDEGGFDKSKARCYTTDENGYYITRADKEIQNNSEDSLDCSEIYPTKEEIIESVIEVNKEKHFYDILFKSTVDYSKYVIEGEKATIIFQSGMLAGKEFDLATDTNGNLICEQDGEYWRVEIVPQSIDGITMPDPDSNYMPNAGESKDTFKVFNIQLPDEYVSEAEWDMFKYAVKHMYANEDAQYTITGTLDEIYAKRNWVNIEGRLQLGNYISFSDKSFQAEPLLIRITGIKEFVNKPHSPVIEFSNQNIGSSLVGTIKRVENEEAYTEELQKQSRSFTQRRFSSAQQTLELLQAAFKNFSEGISPVTVNTMAMLVGDESLQFRFTDSRDSLDDIGYCPLSYDAVSKQLKGESTSLVHMTLDVNAITSPNTMSASDYRSWDVLSKNSAVLDDATQSYYVYVKASQSGITAEYLLSPIAIEMNEGLKEDGTGYYHFLVGILNSEYNNTRDFVTLYGFTEVLPGQITTDVIRSADGKTYFDLVRGVINGSIIFTNSDGSSKSMADFADEQDAKFTDVGYSIERVQDQVDGVVENWSADGQPYVNSYPVSQWNTDADKIAHINDTYVNIETYVDDESTPTAGRAWRWCQCAEGITQYFEIEKEVTSTDWEKIGKIDTDAPYTFLVTIRNGSVLSLNNMIFDTDILVQSGPPVYIKVESATGDVYIKDVGRYFVGYYPIQLRFIYTGYISVTDSEGNTINLHWHPIADSDAVRALKEVSDLQYIKDTFAKGTTAINGGLVMTNMVAVGNNGDNVEAFLNGSDFAGDISEDGHGKLIFAGGIPEGTTDLESRAKSAKTRIYEDGHIETNDIAATGGTFENVVVKGSTRSPFSDGVGFTKQDKDNYVNISDDVVFTMLSNNISESGRRLTFVGSFGIMCQNGYIYDHGTTYDNEYMYIGNFWNATNPVQYEVLTLIAVKTSSTTVAWVVENREPWGETIYSTLKPWGMFAGLRPHVRTISSESAAKDKIITEFDHTIMIDSSSAITLTLPSIPQIGQEYIIMMSNTESTSVKHTIMGSSACKVNHPTSSRPLMGQTSISVDAHGCVRLSCALDCNGTKKWWFYRLG